MRRTFGLSLRRCPIGTIDNSPAIHCRDSIKRGRIVRFDQRWPNRQSHRDGIKTVCVSLLKKGFSVGNTYTSLLFHYIFSTKGRLPLIVPEIEKRLWPYLGGIARKNNMKALAVGGMPDHIHILLSLPATLSVSRAIQIIKGNSSKWINDTFKISDPFSWQKGYGAFSVSLSILQDTIHYIRNQAAHHRRRSFKEEYIDFLNRNGIPYDERHLWI